MRPLLLLALLVLGPATARLHGETYRERLASDPEFKLYAVVFGILQNADGTVRDVTVSKIVDPRGKGDFAPSVKLPGTYLAFARQAIVDSNFKLHEKDGKPVEFYMYFFYAPDAGATLIRSLDAQITAKL